jgi:hypothetical protein
VIQYWLKVRIDMIEGGRHVRAEAPDGIMYNLAVEVWQVNAPDCLGLNQVDQTVPGAVERKHSTIENALWRQLKLEKAPDLGAFQR